MHMTTWSLYKLALKVGVCIYFSSLKWPKLYFPQKAGETWHSLEVNIQRNFLQYLEPQFDCQVFKSLRIELDFKVMPTKFVT